MSTTGALTITMNQEPGTATEPLSDPVNRTHTIESLEFDWHDKRYMCHRDDVGPRGTLLRQATHADHPGRRRIEITARELRPAGHPEAPRERFLFLVSDLASLPSPANVYAWSHAELIGYELVEDE